MEEVKALLKNSLLHIDNEGGLVHLRHALCAKKSIVLFGPTSDLFYGYAENENVRSNVCEEPCEWENAKWNISCKKIKEVECYEAECMKKITIVELGKKVEKLLNR